MAMANSSLWITIVTSGGVTALITTAITLMAARASDRRKARAEAVVKAFELGYPEFSELAEQLAPFLDKMKAHADECYKAQSELEAALGKMEVLEDAFADLESYKRSNSANKRFKSLLLEKSALRQEWSVYETKIRIRASPQAIKAAVKLREDLDVDAPALIGKYAKRHADALAKQINRGLRGIIDTGFRSGDPASPVDRIDGTRAVILVLVDFYASPEKVRRLVARELGWSQLQDGQ
ncbi:hypothetical protein [Nonomuraea sp. KM90]|uniref:hypothetical protein n=1 Tax=Nonomuraea sp. KM90 TaxID=3457428 RepID=UPI003FCDF24F